MPSTTVTPAVTASTTHVPASTRRSLRPLGDLAVARCGGATAERDAQVGERGDDGGDGADRRRARSRPRLAAAENTSSLATKPLVSGMPGLREQEQHEQAAEHRPARRRGRGGRRSEWSSSPWRAQHGDDRERADRHERVDEQVEERGLTALGRAGLDRHEHVAGVRDRRVREQPLQVDLQQRADAADARA